MKNSARIAALAFAAGALVAVTGPAYAADDVRAQGPCAAGSDWELRVTPDDGELEIRYKVDADVPGQVWQYRISDNGAVVSQGTRTASSSSANFEVRIDAADLAGADRVVGQARNTVTGEICQGRVVLP